MDIFKSPIYLVILIVAAITIYFITRLIMKLRKRPAKPKATEKLDNIVASAGISFEKVKVEMPVEKITKEGVINARIYDSQHRSRSLRHVELIPGKNYGRQWLCGTYFVFALQKNGDVLKPVVIPSAMDHPPSELYEALQTKEDVKEVIGNRDEGGDKIKLGLLVLAACVALFIMFMAIYKGGG